MLSFQVDVKRIDKSRLKPVTRDNGEEALFLDLVAFDRIDEYGNEGFITQSLSKDERASGMKLPILGNWKTLGAGRPTASMPPPTQTHQVPAPKKVHNDEDLPF